jgi:hypothetical protein
MTSDEIMALIMGGTAATLSIYSTVTGRPIQTEPPSSALDALIGTDFGPTQNYGAAAGPLAGSGLLVLVLIVGAVVLLGGRK